MDSRENNHAGVCLREDALEEYVLGRVSPAQTGAFSAHIAGCSSCSLRCEELRKEMAALQLLFSKARPMPESGCLNDETIALFLDHSLNPPERGEAVAHMSRCRRCQAKLATLYRELKVVGDLHQPLNLSEFLTPAEPSSLTEKIQETSARRIDEASDEGKSVSGQVPGREDVSQEGADEEERKRRYL